MTSLTLHGELLEVRLVRDHYVAQFKARSPGRQPLGGNHRLTVTAETAKVLGSHLEDDFTIELLSDDVMAPAPTREDYDRLKDRLKETEQELMVRCESLVKENRELRADLARANPLSVSERSSYEIVRQTAEQYATALGRLHKALLGRTFAEPKEAEDAVLKLQQQRDLLDVLLKRAGFVSEWRPEPFTPKLMKSIVEKIRVASQITSTEVERRVSAKLDEMVKVEPAQLPFGEAAWPVGAKSLQIAVCGITVLTASSHERLRATVALWKKRLGDHLQQLVPVLPEERIAANALEEPESTPPTPQIPEGAS